MVPFLFVLGVAQDGGHPQPGCARACCRPGTASHLPSALAIVDPASGQRWLVDATPALPEQLRRLDTVAPAPSSPGLDGILLTHAHMGHYTGLVWLGREVMGARGVPLFVQPRMARFLTDNGPWNQLVTLGNVVLREGTRVQLNERIHAEALPVPHRGEYTETVAWRIEGPTRSALYLPDIDAWEPWDLGLEAVLASVDIAWIDGTFWADGELSRDMTEVPHPRLSATMSRLAALPATERNKVHFIHLNHTNPALDPSSAEAALVRSAGFHVATEATRFEL